MIFLVIGGSSSGPIQIWDQNYGTLIRTLSGHTNTVNSLKMITNTLLASASSDCTIKLWNVTNGICLRTLTWHTYAVYALEYIKSKF